MWGIVFCPEGCCTGFCFAENYEPSYGLLQEKGSLLKRYGRRRIYSGETI